MSSRDGQSSMPVDLSCITVYSPQMLSLEQSNLSQQIASRLRGQIVDGVLPEGSRLNEVHLAKMLGVSRTPLREALTRLVGEGALETQPRKGFFVRPLTLDEFRQLYPIRAILDPRALELAGLPNSERLQHLEELNQTLQTTTDGEQRISLDDAWHLTLLSTCENRILLDLISQFMLRTRRYELAYLRQAEHLNLAVDQHSEIIHALKQNDLNAACGALEQNLQSGLEPIANWLRVRDLHSRGHQ